MVTIRKSKDTIGGRINNLRLDNNDSVNLLSDYLGTTMKVIYNIESNLSEPTLEYLKGIKKRYKVSYEYLIEGE